MAPETRPFLASPANLVLQLLQDGARSSLHSPEDKGCFESQASGGRADVVGLVFKGCERDEQSHGQIPGLWGAQETAEAGPWQPALAMARREQGDQGEASGHYCPTWA